MQSAPGTVETQDLVLPASTNHHGTLFAGEALRSMAKVAFLAARDHAGCEVVMARVGSVDFLAPVPLGRTLRLRGRVGRVGRSSMTVEVTGQADQPGVAAAQVLRGVFEMVAIDAAGRPRRIADPDPNNPTQETSP